MPAGEVSLASYYMSDSDTISPSKVGPLFFLEQVARRDGLGAIDWVRRSNMFPFCLTQKTYL